MNISKKCSLRWWTIWHQSGAIKKPALLAKDLVLRVVGYDHENGYVTLSLGKDDSQSSYWVVPNGPKFNNSEQKLDKLPGNAIPFDLFYAHEKNYKSYCPELSAKNIRTTEDSPSVQNNKGAEMVKISSIVVNGAEVKHVGMPLEISVFDGIYWCGRSNVIYSPSREEIQITDIKDAFSWMKTWLNDQDSIFDYGYILDFATKTVFYDDVRALEHLEIRFPKLKWEGYFETFTKVDFRKK